ncbi:MAG: uracil-DNA glycosylase [Verrucomicrobia bacterium]|nr:MAG: uracil-DNA glycosylase [Verrucomicrobiota bacterium]
MKSHSNMVDRPKLLKDPQERANRIAQLQDLHVAPLTQFVAQLREEVGDEAGIPEFDPWDGGIAAEILFLLEAPGAKAVKSGFISRNNNDESAKNFYEISFEANIPRTRTITWNIVPWYIGTGSKIRAATGSDIVSGSSSLSRFLDLLPKLKVIVLVGLKAQCAEEMIRTLRPNAHIVKSYHPSPRFVNRYPRNRSLIVDAFRAAGLLLNNEEA